jgi:hypothetical protein
MFGEINRRASLIFRARFASHPPTHRSDTSINFFSGGGAKRCEEVKPFWAGGYGKKNTGGKGGEKPPSTITDLGIK